MPDDVLFSLPDEPGSAPPATNPASERTPPAVSAPDPPAPTAGQPPCPVVRLLALADQFTQHNDSLARLRPAYGAARGHASAQVLASACTDAVKAIEEQSLPATAAVREAAIRIKQLAYLTEGSSRHLAAAKALLSTPAPETDQGRGGRDIVRQTELAQELTALGPASALQAATTVALAMNRRSHPGAMDAGRLTHVERATLNATARGHLATGWSAGQEFAHSQTGTAYIATVLSLEQQGLIAREPASAPPAADGGPPQDRVRLTLKGAMIVAAQLGRGLYTPAPATTAARATPAPARPR
ncbi:hypothetical protein [Streptomyces sp. NPDC047014]|uniref:hypothetical protein n=1 Tax=Streptomyces sp. NPDC047014 TaxID=3155736 RepID=UPI00340A155B